MTDPGFSISDRRASARTASGLHIPGANWQATANQMRSRGYTLPTSGTQARIQARKVVSEVRERGTVTDVQNRAMASAMRQERFQRVAARTGGGMAKTGANVQMVLPKVRQPLSSLLDKGIPFNVQDPKELTELRRWCRLFYSTHDLVPLLVDIYSKFPVTGLEFVCLAAETPVITSEGVREIGELAGGVHRILTTGGKWVDAPFKNFGAQALRKITVQRNGRQREFYATPEHRWFVEEHHKPRLGRNKSKWSPLTWEKVDLIREQYSTGARQVDIAHQFGISQVMVSKIVNHQSWTARQRLAEESRPEPGWHKVEVVTQNLKPGMKLVSSYGRNLIHATNPSPFGVAHGVTFGDGTRNTCGRGCHVDLYGEKDANLLRYFTGCAIYDYGPREKGAVASVRVTDLPGHFKDRPPLTESTSYLYGWLAGYFAADGTVNKKGEVFLDSARLGDIVHAQAVCQILGIHTSDPYLYEREEGALPQGGHRGPHTIHRLRFTSESLTEQFFCIPEHLQKWLPHADRPSNENWHVVSVKKTNRIEEVYCAVVPSTGAFTLDGNILTGNCKDPKIEQFYESMFMDDLNYEEFLPDGLMREYFMVGEVTALAHFNEQLGIWSSEEILNPDMVRVSKSLFIEEERVQLMVKELVETLRTGPMGMSPSEESPSERYERTWEYQQIVKHYPEIIKAASQDDGLDISDALVSRMVNKAAWWDLRGTPHLLRSFRTLMLEESLNAAQDAVCDRLYAPMILATLGIEGAMGDGEPWIPDQGELEELRDDIQSALAADFKLLCHNFGLKIESVFGRESVPRFDTDYDRVDAKLMQAWGIGQALIMGGTGAGGTYASSAINREVCEQLMKSAQNKAIRHMRKRMEVIAEAQEHYDFDLKGGVRVPIYREIVQYNEETGEQEIVRVPKLLIPDIKFSTLNLRDEATERSFVSQLKQMGVPVSDKSLAINIPFEFKQELERQAQETKDKGMAQAEAMHVLQEQLDEKGYAYPPELAQFLQATLSVRAGLAQAEAAESQNKMLDQQVAQASPAGMMGLLPGTTMMPLAGSGSTAPPGQEPPEQPSEQDPGATADPTLGAGASSVAAPQTTASMHGPRMAPPGGAAPPPGADDDFFTPEIPRNRNRPEESDEMRAGAPKKAHKVDTGLPGRNGQPDPVIATSRFTKGPSSYGRSKTADERRVQAAIRRREMEATGNHPDVAQLIHDPNFWAITNSQAYERQIIADFPEIQAGGAPESAKLLQELVEEYEHATGIRPRW